MTTTSGPTPFECLPFPAPESLVVTDAGLETWLSFDRGFELPSFAAYPLAGTEEGRAGVARAAEHAALPAVIAFTLETDGRLPSGMPLAEAVEATDQATDSYPTHYMINCAHPSHFEHVVAEADCGTDHQHVEAITSALCSP